MKFGTNYLNSKLRLVSNKTLFVQSAFWTPVLWSAVIWFDLPLSNTSRTANDDIQKRNIFHSFWNRKFQCFFSLEHTTVLRRWKKSISHNLQCDQLKLWCQNKSWLRAFRIYPLFYHIWNQFHILIRFYCPKNAKSASFKVTFLSNIFCLKFKLMYILVDITFDHDQNAS